MDDQHVGEDMKNARSRETSFTALAGQILIVATAVGIATGSWRWGAGSVLGLAIALGIKPLAVFLIMLLSLGWAVIGYEIGASLFDSDSARFILGGVSFFVALAVNSCGLNWHEDIGHK